MEFHHLPQGKFLDQFLVGCNDRQILKNLFYWNLTPVFVIFNFTRCGMNVSGDDLKQSRFPRAVPPKNCIGMIFLKGIAEIAEDPFRIILFAGTG